MGRQGENRNQRTTGESLQNKSEYVIPNNKGYWQLTVKKTQGSSTKKLHAKERQHNNGDSGKILMDLQAWIGQGYVI